MLDELAPGGRAPLLDHRDRRAVDRRTTYYMPFRNVSIETPLSF